MEGAGQPRERRRWDVSSVSRAVERERERCEAGGGGEDGQWDARRVGQVTHQLPHLLQSIPLHQDVILGKQQRRYFTQFTD